MNFSDGHVGFGAPLSQAGKLAADIAMTREVLARLHRAERHPAGAPLALAGRPRR